MALAVDGNVATHYEAYTPDFTQPEATLALDLGTAGCRTRLLAIEPGWKS